MIADSVCHELNEVWFLFLQDVLTSLSCSLPTGQSIVSINSGTGNTHWNGSGNDTIWGILVNSWCWNGVLVVSDQEQSLTLKSGSEVKRNCEIALAGSTFTQVAGSNLAVVIDSESVTRSGGLWDLSGWINGKIYLKVKKQWRCWVL